MKLNKQRVLSGIRATGRLHLGNYLGAVKGMLELQHRGDLDTLYMVADAHTLTTPYEVAQLRDNRLEVIADYLAAGLDPAKSILFLQSDVSEHFELAFYLSSITTIAKMQHLPTFKDKVKQHPEHATMALLNYPVLMAADILLYKANLVPVGVDQEPHLEVAREIARKMNGLYGTDLPEPTSFATAGKYVPSLTGEGKMSKSVEGSYITLADDLVTIQRRLASAPTDLGKGSTLPTSGGVFNLLEMVELFLSKAKRQDYEQKYLSDAGIRFKDLKEELAQAIFAQLEPIQQRRQELAARPEYIKEVAKDGAARAREIAQVTLLEVKEKLGLIS